MGDNVTLLAAFGAGFLSFISPCVLPLIPGYLSFVSGVSLEEMRGDAAGAARRRVLVTSLAFVLGFSLVFITLGASASVIGKFLLRHNSIIGKIAGVLVIIFGLHTMGVFRIPFLESDTRLRAGAKPKSARRRRRRHGIRGLDGRRASGRFFRASWCWRERIPSAKRVVMLAVLMLGLGIPFILTALAIKFFARPAGSGSTTRSGSPRVPCSSSSASCSSPTG